MKNETTIQQNSKKAEKTNIVLYVSNDLLYVLYVLYVPFVKALKDITFMYSVPYTLHVTCTLHVVLYTLYPTCTLYPVPYMLYSIPYTQC
jgi:hypothetical protein